MKTKTLRSLLGLILAIGLLAAVAIPLPSVAQASPDAVAFSPVILDAASVPLATAPAITAPVSAPSAVVTGELTKTAPVSAPWYAGTEVLSAIIALVTGLIAVWSHKEKKTALKVSESLILGIEAASKIPAVAEKEKQIKAKIKEVTKDNGVAPVVAALVARLT